MSLARSLARPLASSLAHGLTPLAGLDAGHWQANAPADAAGDANTVSQLWSGAITATTFTWSAKCSASATNVRLVISRSPGLSNPAYSTDPVATANGHAKNTVEGLDPNTTYYWGLLVDGVLKDGTIGRFKTLPDSAAFSYRFTLGSCSDNDVATSFTGMAALNPLFFVHMGDIHYGDVNTTTLADHLAAMNGMFSDSDIADFYATTPTLSVWSDHDYCGDASDEDSTGKATAQSAFRAKRPHPTLEVADGIYHSVQIGRVVFVMTDGRSFRTDPNATDDASKTVLGSTQKTWLKNLLVDAAYDDCIFALVVPEPWMGTSDDAWSEYTTERAELGDYIIANGLLGRVIMLSGDAHCIAIDGGNNVEGSFPVFQAAPLSQTNSTKSIVADIGPLTTSEQQYGVIDVTDDGGDVIELRLRAFTGAGASLADKTYYLSPTAPTPVRTVIEQGEAFSVTSQTLTISAPAAGNRLFLKAIVDKIAGPFFVPTDDGTGAWSLVGAAYEGEDGVSGALFTKISGGDETEIVASWTNSHHPMLQFVEVTRAGAVDQFGLSTEHGVSAGRSSGTITAEGAIAGAPQLALAFMGTDSAASSDTATAHGWSDDFVKIDAMGMGAADYNFDIGHPAGMIGFKLLPTVQTPETEGTWSGDVTDEAMGTLATIQKAA